MLSIEQDLREVLRKEVVLFTEDCSPYYVSPAVPRDLWSMFENNSLIEEVTSIVHTVSSLKLSLSYVMPLKHSPLGRSVKCSVSKFAHGYVATFIEDKSNKTRVNSKAADYSDACCDV